MNSNLYLILMLLVFGFSLIAQSLTRSAYQKYSQIPSAQGLTGGDIARRILAQEGIENVAIEEINGSLTDHYDPKNLVLRLSTDTMHGRNVASLSVAAHEVGHVLQHRDAYAPLCLRTACAKSVGFGSQAAIPIFFLGLLLSYSPLLYIGLGLYALIVFFTLISLPVEFNASRRALAALTSGGYLPDNEMRSGARKVLTAAALTYVAAALSAVLQFLRLLAQSKNQRRRR